MDVRFRGEHALRTDDKCRLAIPAAYRSALQAHGDARLVITRSLTDACLQVFPAKAWAQYEDKILTLPRSDPTVRRVLQFQVTSSVLIEPDGHGRFVLPPALRTHAGLGPAMDVTVASQIDRFEIWAQDRWLAEQALCAETLGQWSADLARLGL